MVLDISQLTEAASANARGVAGGATKAPAKSAAAKPKSPAKALSASAAPAGARTRTQSKPAAARSSANKRRDGTVRLSLDVPAGDVDAFRAFAKARRHSQETVFRAALHMLLSADRTEYLDIVEGLPQS